MNQQLAQMKGFCVDKSNDRNDSVLGDIYGFGVLRKDKTLLIPGVKEDGCKVRSAARYHGLRLGRKFSTRWSEERGGFVVLRVL